MTATKTECVRCGTSIVQSTAKDTGGLCRPCEAGPDVETVSDGIEIGFRFTKALVFAIFAAGIGYTIGSVLGDIGSMVLSVPFTAVGFVYGFFSTEINAIIRLAFGWFVDP